MASSLFGECKSSSVISPVFVIRETKQIGGERNIVSNTGFFSHRLLHLPQCHFEKSSLSTNPLHWCKMNLIFCFAPIPSHQNCCFVRQKQWPYWKNKVKFRWQKTGVRQTSRRNLSSKWGESRYLNTKPFIGGKGAWLQHSPLEISSRDHSLTLHQPQHHIMGVSPQFKVTWTYGKPGWSSVFLF